MRIGYACLTLGVPGTELKSCTMKNAGEETLAELIRSNLNALETMIGYNAGNGIRLFRISSDLIPFGSSPVNPIPWWETFAARFQTIGQKIAQNGIRVSMHPGQYTVLNSPEEGIVSRAIDDLNYHCRILDSLGTDSTSKIVLHVGGVYQDKKAATKRFAINFDRLEDAVKRRLVLENDERCYNIQEVLELGRQLEVPVIFDNLHHRINPGDSTGSEAGWIEQCSKTWGSRDGSQKIHYSQQALGKKTGSHSETIRKDEFLEFYRRVAGADPDIMLEVKDKNLSALKCIHCTSSGGNIKRLEQEWGRYKYSVLEHSHSHYLQIRELLKDKGAFPAIPFYTLVEEALNNPVTAGGFVNAAQHVWGYFKDPASDKERAEFYRKLYAYQDADASAESVKSFLSRLAEKYRQSYLLNSYYFVL